MNDYSLDINDAPYSIHVNDVSEKWTCGVKPEYLEALTLTAGRNRKHKKKGGGMSDTTMYFLFFIGCVFIGSLVGRVLALKMDNVSFERRMRRVNTPPGRVDVTADWQPPEHDEAWRKYVDGLPKG